MKVQANNIETGQVKIKIELTNGDIIVRHGSSNEILHIVKEAKSGTWDMMWKHLRKM